MYHKKQSTNKDFSEKGQGLTEYAIILMLAGLVVFGIVSTFNPQIENVFRRLVNQAPVAPPALMAYTPPPTASSTAGPGTATATPTETLTPTPSNTPTATSTGQPPPTNTATPTRDFGYREYRYVRVIAESEVNDSPFASMAEMELMDGYSNFIDRTNWSVHYISSEEPDTPASNVFDGNNNSIWHTEWRDSLPEHPHDLQIDLGALYNLSYFQYLPRQNSANGRIANYRFCASVDGTSWDLLASGTFANSSAQQATSFTPPADSDTMPDCPLSTAPTPTNTPTVTNTPTETPTNTPTVTPTSTPDPGAPTCTLALGKTAVSSSVENGSHPASHAVDGNFTTRWSSQYNDNEWIYIDLGARYNITRVILNWEAAFGSDYQIMVTDDLSGWTTINTIRNGNGGTDDMQNLTGVGRYVAMAGSDRGTGWGYSLWEFEVCGTPNNQVTLIDADFESDEDGFSYQDDTFYGTDEGYYARGDRRTNGEGNDNSDSLRIRLGGRDDDDIYDMSGGWVQSFNLSSSSDINVSFYYRLHMADAYEEAECSEVLVSIDGQLYGAGGNDYVTRECNGSDTGWQEFSFSTTGGLSSGSHTIIIGGYNNRKTTDDELTRIWFDDVFVETSE